MEYISNTLDEQRKMLSTIGVGSIENLWGDIPTELRLKKHLQLPEPLSELSLKNELLRMSQRSDDLIQHACFLGAGAYDHYIPSVVGHLAFRSEFYTSYTPYQAEMSQGLLQSIYEFQTMISELMGMEIANASLYDGASALAEAAMMALRVTRRKKLVISRTIHPHYRAVLKTYLSGSQVEIEEIDWLDGRTDNGRIESVVDDDTAGVLLQTPNFFGCLEPIEEIVPSVQNRGALAIVCADPIGLGVLSPPGSYGVDIAVGEGQGLGCGLNFGGPNLGLFATRKAFARQMPGRVVGATVDGKGRSGFCLTLQTREQHIKRERATSNICTNEALAALAATIYLTTMGPQGLGEVGRLCIQKAHYLQRQITEVDGYECAFSSPFFKEFVVKTPMSPSRLNKRLRKSRIVGGLDLGGVARSLKNHWLLCVTEKRTKDEMDRFVSALKSVGS